MNAFDVRTPGDIRFGRGRADELAGALADLGVRRALLVTGRTPERVRPVRDRLEADGIAVEGFGVGGEPSVDLVRDAVTAARAGGCDGVVGVGGGSVLDTAKAVAGLARSGADPLDHLEVVGAGRPLVGPVLPCVAVPTTAGTGSEVTRNAVLAARSVKASLRSPLLLPRVALVDPDLLRGLPRPALAAGGMDALTQLIEPFLSCRANPVTDALAREGLRRSARSLRLAYRLGPGAEVGTGVDPGTGAGADLGADLESGRCRAGSDEAEGDAAGRREDLALASLLGGLCLANAGLGVVHGFAGVIGGRFGAPHGAVCAALLAPAVEVNLRALAERAPAHPSLARGTELATLLTGSPDATVEDGLSWLARLRTDLDLPGLSHFGMTPDDAPSLVRDAGQASSMRANPIELTPGELTEIVLRAG